MAAPLRFLSRAPGDHRKLILGGKSDLILEDDLVTEGTMSGLQKSLLLLLVGLCGMSAASYFSTGSPFTVLQVLF